MAYRKLVTLELSDYPVTMKKEVSRCTHDNPSASTKSPLKDDYKDLLPVFYKAPNLGRRRSLSTPVKPMLPNILSSVAESLPESKNPPRRRRAKSNPLGDIGVPLDPDVDTTELSLLSLSQQGRQRSNSINSSGNSLDTPVVIPLVKNRRRASSVSILEPVLAPLVKSRQRANSTPPLLVTESIKPSVTSVDNSSNVTPSHTSIKDNIPTSNVSPSHTSSSIKKLAKASLNGTSSSSNAVDLASVIPLFPHVLLSPVNTFINVNFFSGLLVPSSEEIEAEAMLSPVSLQPTMIDHGDKNDDKFPPGKPDKNRIYRHRRRPKVTDEKNEA